MIAELRRLAMKIARLEQRMDGMIRLARVTTVDPSKGTVEAEIGPGHVGPAVPYAQQAGGLAVHTPPTVGQMMILMSPSGDPRSAVAVPGPFGGAVTRPGETGEENVITFGDVKVVLAGDGLTATVGGMTLTLTGAGVVVTGGDVAADGISLKGHKHPHDDPKGITGPPG